MAQFPCSIASDKHEFGPDRWAKTIENNGTYNAVHASHLPTRRPSTGITVLIVGAGMAGLMTALECWRKGHDVVGILERRDIIVIQPSAISILHYWPDMLQDLEQDQIHAAVSYETHNGRHIYGPTVPSFNDAEYLAARKSPYVAPAQIRRKFYRMLLRQVARCGLRVEYGKTVKEYFEDANAGKGGVIIEAARNIEIARVADIVVAADGLKSSSQILIAGQHIPTKSSGMSIYRTAFDKSLAMQDKLVRKRWGQSPPVWEYWLGPGMYLGVFIGNDIVSYGFTPRDNVVEGSATESWEPNTDPETVARAMLSGAPDWDPAVIALVRTAPRGSIVHWPLLWRDLRREWTSPSGRVVQVGDSAHSFIPTSGNGASQALEDAITLATCLQLAGDPEHAGLGSKVYNLLRYERVSCAQKMSFVNSQLKTDTDWDAIWKDPAKIRTRFPAWIFKHDPEAYGYEKFGEAFAHLTTGSEFANTNFPPGHAFRAWTVDEVWRDIESGKRVEDLLDRDWS
ncbi:FAD-dependent oxidoreductase [Aspergillus mulundensis]|uniref:FAD-dependent monooxygenase mdpD n=1 Tax=Aspergillus mulundensis TaxID=1810919 RepID=A0A3D8QM90_9EURO|nr:FAD-dependent monooxygenase mdpD [Aspergillus mulundensis]RDW62912.1 FAD-dependent monooxygenase mdpD [Aspergillus mulundensis]